MWNHMEWYMYLVEFPYRYTDSPFGPLPDPRISISVETLYGWKSLQFVVDSGSDVTLVSREIADLVGLDFKNAPMLISGGIGGNGLRTYRGSMRIRIGSAEVEIPTLFSSQNTTPSLLGRAGVFDFFNLTFDNLKKAIIFQSI